MSGMKIYHICNLSPKVIFRKEEDFLITITRLAVCAYVTHTEVLAYSVMSTHFHIVVRTDNLSEFLRLFKRSISTWHSHQYANAITLSVSFRELHGRYEVQTAINYVLKNAVHHKICDIAFVYPYSSINVYFYSELNRREYFLGEFVLQTYKCPGDLSKREYKRLFGSHAVPDTFQILAEMLVIPESFVKSDLVCKIYSSAKIFLYNMTKPLKEELEMFGDDVDGYNADSNLVALVGKLTDIEVCRVVDALISPKVYSQIDTSEKSVLWEKLKKMGVALPQFERCV